MNWPSMLLVSRWVRVKSFTYGATLTDTQTRVKDSVQYDQNAFTVSEAAKKAKCSERVASLAQHVRR